MSFFADILHQAAADIVVDAHRNHSFGCDRDKAEEQAIREKVIGNLNGTIGGAQAGPQTDSSTKKFKIQFPL